MSVWVRLYVGAVAVGAVALVGFSWDASAPAPLALVTAPVFLLAHIGSTEAFHRFRNHPALRRASITELDGAWLGAGAVLLPPMWAGLLAGSAALYSNLRLRRSAPVKVVFNCANYVVGFTVASSFAHLGHVPDGVSLARLGWVAATIVLAEVVSAVVRLGVIKLSAPSVTLADALGFGAPTFVYFTSSVALGLMVAATPESAPYLGAVALLIVMPLQRLITAEQMRAEARHDSKTGLLRIEAWHEQLELTVRQARRAGAGVGVMVVDIDFFKRVNDTVGHLVADGILAQVAATIRGQLRPGDIAGRFGGEEFVVAFVAPSPEAAAELAERIRSSCVLHEPEWSDRLPPVTVSVGVAVSACADLDVPQLLTDADDSLLHAKQTGRNRVVIAEPSRIRV